MGCVPKDSILREDLEPGIVGEQDGVFPDPDDLPFTDVRFKSPRRAVRC